MPTNHIFLPNSDHCCSPKRRRGRRNQGFPRRPARQDTSDQPDPTVSFPPAGSLLTTLRLPTIPTSSTNMPIRSTQRAAIPIPVEAREEPFEAADEPVALPVLPVLLPLVTGAGVDVVVVAPPAATVVVVVEAVVVVVVGVAPLDEPASTSACAFSLETCIPTARQSPGPNSSRPKVCCSRIAGRDRSIVSTLCHSTHR